MAKVDILPDACRCVEEGVVCVEVEMEMGGSYASK
jgi:hypothetical protein